MKLQNLILCLSLVSAQAGAATPDLSKAKESEASKICKFTTENGASVKKAILSAMDLARSGSETESLTGDEEYDRSVLNEMRSKEGRKKLISTFRHLGFKAGSGVDTEWATIALVDNVQQVSEKDENLAGSDLIDASYENLKKTTCQEK